MRSLRTVLWAMGALGLWGPLELRAADPSILVQPRSGTVGAGADFGFNVLPGGTEPFTYQWNFNGAPLAGQTGPVVWLTNVVAAHAGAYSVDVANALGTVRSSSRTLTVRDPAVVQPPASASAIGGDDVLLSVKAAGTPPLHYQWMVNKLPLSGATNDTLFLTAVTRADAGNYTVEISNAVGKVASAAAALTVSDPVLVLLPTGGDAAAGDGFCFQADAIGSGPLSFQWRRQGAVIPNATNSQLCLSNLTDMDAGQYSVTVSNASGQVTSPGVSLKVIDLAIARSPESRTVSGGDSVALTGAAVGQFPIAYQWLFNGAPLPGATSATLMLSGVTGAQSGVYALQASNAAGVAVSAPAQLTVVDPAILAGPVGGSTVGGRDFAFTVAAAGTPPLSYEWLKDGVAVPGATGSQLALTGVEVSDSGAYAARVSNGAGMATSAPATLIVFDPVIVQQPQSAKVGGGADVTFEVTAEGTAPITYQWLFQGNPLGGETGSSLTLAGVTPGQSGAYAARVSNGSGTVQSAAAQLTVSDPFLLSQPAGTNVVGGEDVVLAVTAEGTAPLGYQWLRNGVEVAGATSSTLSLPGASPSDSGTYTVRVSSGGGAVVSQRAVVTVGDPAILEQPEDGTAAAGNDFEFDVVAAGTPPFTYQWRHKGVNLAGATNDVLTLTNVTSAQNGAYSVVISNGFGRVTSEDASLTVKDPFLVSHPAGGVAGLGEAFMLSAVGAGTTPLIYQWRFKGNNLPGEVNPTLVLRDLAAADEGAYSVNVRNAAGNVTSSNAFVEVSAIPPRIVATGDYVTTNAPGTAQLQLVMEGNGTENALSFSVGFDPAVVANPVFTPSPNAAAATMVQSGDQVGIALDWAVGETFSPVLSEEIGILSFDVAPGQNPLRAGIYFSGDVQPLAARDLAGRSFGLIGELRPVSEPVEPSATLHGQSGLFTQRLLVANPTASTNTICISVGDPGFDEFGNAIFLYNAQLSEFIDLDGDGDAESPVDTVCIPPVLDGEEAVVTLEFYVSDRSTVPMTEYSVYFGGIPPLQPPATERAIAVRSAQFVGGEFLLDFSTSVDFLYFVQYSPTPDFSADNAAVRTSDPPVAGTGGMVRWIDSGLPRTESAPQNGMRFYRVLRGGAR